MIAIGSFLLRLDLLMPPGDVGISAGEFLALMPRPARPFLVFLLFADLPGLSPRSSRISSSIFLADFLGMAFLPFLSFLAPDVLGVSSIVASLRSVMRRLSSLSEPWKDVLSSCEANWSWLVIWI